MGMKDKMLQMINQFEASPRYKSKEIIDGMNELKKEMTCESSLLTVT